MKLLMMKGLPASGKSTKAKEFVDQGNWVRVNKDLLRKMLHFDKFTGKNESITVGAEKALVRYFLSNDMNVIVDDTNMGSKHRECWKNIALENDAEFAVFDRDTPIDELIKREDERQKVGRGVIYRMALQFERLPKPEKPFVLCDIDGTIADCSHRLSFVQGEEKNWKAFFGAMSGDTPIKETIDMLEEYKKKGHQIILLTARPEDYRKQTEEWVDNFTNIKPLTIIMRNSGDTRPDVEVKQQMYDLYFRDKYEIETMIDDRPSVIRMWKENKVPVIDVGDGKEF